MGRRVLAAGALSALLLVSIACSVSYETVNGKLPIADPFFLLWNQNLRDGLIPVVSL